MSERVGIVGSRIWPTPNDVTAYVATLPPGTVVVSGGADGVDTWAVEAATQHGLPQPTIHYPDKQRYGIPACFYHRNKAIVTDSDRVVAFAAKDPKTKAITAGTSMTIDLAERADVPVETILTPVPGRICVLLESLRRQLANLRGAQTSAQHRARVRALQDTLKALTRAREEFEQRMLDGWEEVEETPDGDERDRMETAWCDVLLPTYRVVSDALTDTWGAVIACH